MSGGLHYTFDCPDCAAPIAIPLEMLSQAFRDLIQPSEDVEPIVFVCAHCKHVQNRNLTRKSQNPPLGPMVLLSRDSGWTCVGWLKCEGATCKFLFPLFAKWNPGLSEVEQLAAQKEWKWDGLTCPDGHPIPKPA